MACAINPASETVADFIIRYYAFTPLFTGSDSPACVDLVNRNYAVVHWPLSLIPPLSLNTYDYAEIPSLYTLLDTTALESAGILRTFNQPTLGVKGRGTILGIVDTGIDYQNPLFRNSDGTSRILGIWDQTIEGNGILAESPQDNIQYGVNFTKSQIDEALASNDPLSLVPTRDTNGHGTFLAEIAAGNETTYPDFSGAAPECMLAVVKLKPAKAYLREYYIVPPEAEAYQENDLMLGIKYLILVARQYSLPLTILLGLGTNTGSHDGTSPLALYLNGLGTYTGIITVLAAGNETGFGHHYFGVIASEEEYQDVEIHVGANELGFTIEMWATQSELYSVGFVSPTGERIDRIPNVRKEDQRITFLLEETIIYLNYRVAEVETGSQLIVMRFQAPTPGLWRIRVYNSVFINGEYHMWLPCRGFISDQTYFLRSNPDTTVTEPGNAPLTLTIGAYDHHDNSLYIHSSRGYTRLGIVKPDLTAPGVNVTLPDGRSLTGTSVAAAYAAGASANLLSWAITQGNDLFMNTSIAKSFFIRGARRNPIFTYPNRELGYGNLDLYNSFLLLRE